MEGEREKTESNYLTMVSKTHFADVFTECLLAEIASRLPQVGNGRHGHQTNIIHLTNKQTNKYNNRGYHFILIDKA